MVAGTQVSVAQGVPADILGVVLKRGTLVCGVAMAGVGLSVPDSQGIRRGVDADYCRVLGLAAAAYLDGAAVPVAQVVWPMVERPTPSASVAPLFRGAPACASVIPACSRRWEMWEPCPLRFPAQI